MSINFSLSLALFALMSTSIAFADAHAHHSGAEEHSHSHGSSGAHELDSVDSHVSETVTEVTAPKVAVTTEEPTEPPTCDGILIPGMYARVVAPIAALEVNIYASDRMSMGMYVHLNETALLFTARALEFTFDPEKCLMRVTGGSGTWRRFGAGAGTFANPNEMVGMLRPEIPKGEVDLDHGLQIIVEENGLKILGVFPLDLTHSAQDWLAIMRKNEAGKGWNMTEEEIEAVKKIPDLMTPPEGALMGSPVGVQARAQNAKTAWTHTLGAVVALLIAILV
jgi:hypothetical protein